MMSGKGDEMDATGKAIRDLKRIAIELTERTPEERARIWPWAIGLSDAMDALYPADANRRERQGVDLLIDPGDPGPVPKRVG